MKHVIFTGGLGNQMFEYALTIALRHQGYCVQIDTSYYDFFQMHNGYELERVFGIEEFCINKQGLHMFLLRLLHKTRPRLLYRIDDLKYDESIICKPQSYLFDYWQDERYFSEVKEQVRTLFSFKGVDERNLKIAKRIQSCNSVSLHIRRGDYAVFGKTIIKDDFYERAVKEITSHVNNPLYFIFSDDIDASKEIVNKLGINYVIMGHNSGKNSYLDMFLMSQCKHNIIANSSFSWWGAWLNDNNNKIIIAPKVWDAKISSFTPQCKSWILM